MTKGAKLATDLVHKKRTGVEKERAIEIACQRESLNAVNELFKIIKDETVDIRWRIVAIKEVLDRGFGRPKQQVNSVVTVDGSDALLEAIARGKARAAVTQTVRVIDNDTHFITYEQEETITT